MRRTLPSLIAIATILAAGPALAQLSGGVGGSSGAGGSSGIGGSSGSGVVTGSGSGAGGIGSTSGVGSGSSLSDTGASPTLTDPIAPGASSGSTGLGADTTEGLASEGSSTINSLNAEGLARSEAGAGTSSVTSFGTSDTIGTPGAGPDRAYRITKPTVAVDLGSIRRGLSSAPSAIPKANGD
ncbi:hypothetical protein [Aurantimonas manganoxydans]|uniref:hypothetical protein n=1 Tax=Aurantimonas manganoxydans TaxID=651183 RepID=UPI0002F95E75|nr:hypothetical protein [Aurantimonas manganoxydans]